MTTRFLKKRLHRFSKDTNQLFVLRPVEGVIVRVPSMTRNDGWRITTGQKNKVGEETGTGTGVPSKRISVHQSMVYLCSKGQWIAG